MKKAIKQEYIPLQLLLSRTRNNDCVTFFTESTTLSFNDFYKSVSALAYFLSDQEQQRWCLFCNDSFAFTVGFFALLHSGKTAILPQNAQTGTLSNLSHDFAAIISDLNLSTERNLCINPLKIEDNRDFHFNELPLTEHRIEMFTSGTTGKPVRALKTVGHLVSEVAELELCFGAKLASSLIYSTVSHQHIYGLLFKILWPLSAGRSVFCNNIAYPEELLVHMHQEQVNTLISSPAHLKRMPDLIDLKQLSKRCSLIFSSGGPLAPSVSSDFLSRAGIAPMEILGSTETGGIAWRQLNAEIKSRQWQPFSTVEIKPNREAAPLKLRSSYAGDNPGKEWVQTGDLIKHHDSGKFELLGRADSIVKIEGKRVSLTEIQDRLNENKHVTRAIAILLESKDSIKRDKIGAVITPSTAGKELLASAGPKALSDALKEDLGRYFESVAIPRSYRYVETEPENSQGKLSNEALQKLFRSR